MKLVFMGTPHFAVPSLEALLKAGHQVLAVVTQPDRRKGRRLKLFSPPVKDVVLKNGLTVLQPETLKDKSFYQKLTALKPEAVIIAAYGKIIPRWLLELPKRGCVNLHPSLLPAYRGATPIQRAIMEGKKETGVTTMLMDEGLDTGDILLQTPVSIEPEETGGSLEVKLSQVGARLLTLTLKSLVENKVSPTKQRESEATCAPKITKEEAQIDWSRSGGTIVNLVRALNPTPGAFTFYKNLRLKIWRLATHHLEASGPPGTVLLAGKEELVVASGDGALSLLEVQPESKPKMAGDAFCRGYRVKVGDKLRDKK